MDVLSLSRHPGPAGSSGYPNRSFNGISKLEGQKRPTIAAPPPPPPPPRIAEGFGEDAVRGAFSFPAPRELGSGDSKVQGVLTPPERLESTTTEELDENGALVRRETFVRGFSASGEELGSLSRVAEISRDEEGRVGELRSVQEVRNAAGDLVLRRDSSREISRDEEGRVSGQRFSATISDAEGNTLRAVEVNVQLERDDEGEILSRTVESRIEGQDVERRREGPPPPPRPLFEPERGERAFGQPTNGPFGRPGFGEASANDEVESERPVFAQRDFAQLIRDAAPFALGETSSRPSAFQSALLQASARDLGALSVQV